MRALLVGATAAGAFAAASFIPAHAETVSQGPVTVVMDPGSQSGSITVSGDQGYLTAYGSAATQNGDICGEAYGTPAAGCVGDVAP